MDKLSIQTVLLISFIELRKGKGKQEWRMVDYIKDCVAAIHGAMDCG